MIESQVLKKKDAFLAYHFWISFSTPCQSRLKSVEKQRYEKRRKSAALSFVSKTNATIKSVWALSIFFQKELKRGSTFAEWDFIG